MKKVLVLTLILLNLISLKNSLASDGFDRWAERDAYGRFTGADANGWVEREHGTINIYTGKNKHGEICDDYGDVKDY